MILFTIIIICILGSLFRPIHYHGFYGPRFHHRRPFICYGHRGPMYRRMHDPRRF